MTIEDLRKVPKGTLTVAQAAEYLGCSAQQLRVCARERPELLGFPTIIVNSRVLIPKEAFIRFVENPQGDT